MINKQANQMFCLLLNVNDYQHSSLQVVGDHSAIIMVTDYYTLFISLIYCVISYHSVNIFN